MQTFVELKPNIVRQSKVSLVSQARVIIVITVQPEICSGRELTFYDFCLSSGCQTGERRVDSPLPELSKPLAT